MVKRFLIALAAVAAVAGIALPASASTAMRRAPDVTAMRRTVVNGPGTTDGTAGYLATYLGAFVKSGIATWDLTVDGKSLGTTTSLANPKGAAGIGACNSGDGDAAEVGHLYNGSTFEIADAVGKLGNNGGDRCVSNGILTNGSVVHPLLTGLVPGTVVTAEFVEYAHGVTFFVENDNTTQSFSSYVTFGKVCTWHAGYWFNGHWKYYDHGKKRRWVRTWHKGYDVCHAAPHQYYNEALAGVFENLTSLGGSASNDLVDFSGVKFNGVPMGSWDAEAINSSATGSAPWLVGPSVSVNTGPNSEPCLPSLANENLASVNPVVPLSPGYGPLSTTGLNFSVCSAPAVGA